jgi:hypothetical protein
MNYNPGVQDQRANLIMQGNANSIQSGNAAMALFKYFQERKDAKDAAIGQLTAMGGDGTGTSDDSGGFDSTTGGSGGDPGESLDSMSKDASNPALDNAELDGKKAHSIRTMMSNYTQDPQQKTALKAKSLGELEGMLKGYATKAAMAEHSAKMEEFQAHAAEFRQNAQNDVEVGKGLQRWNNPPMDENGDPLEGDELVRYAMSGVSGRAAPKLLDAITRATQASSDTVASRENPYPGVTVYGTRKGTMFSVTDPAAKEANLTPVPYTDPNTSAHFVKYGKDFVRSDLTKPDNSSDMVSALTLKSKLITTMTSDPMVMGNPKALKQHQAMLDQLDGEIARMTSRRDAVTPAPVAGADPAKTGVSKPKVYKTAEDVRDDPDLSDGQKLTILTKQFKFRP